MEILSQSARMLVKLNIMLETIQSSFPPFPNFDILTESFDKLNSTDIFLQLHGVYIVHK